MVKIMRKYPYDSKLNKWELENMAKIENLKINESIVLSPPHEVWTFRDFMSGIENNRYQFSWKEGKNKGEIVITRCVN